jgi:multidrug transporter EmrE-like cation transporter
MRPLILSSVAFGVGALFMRPTSGISRVVATIALALCFAAGGLLMATAVQRGGLSTTYLLGLGLEAVITIAIGTLLLHERLGPREWGAISLILAGLVVLKA